MLPGQKFTAEDLVGILKRWWWLTLPPLAVGLALGILVFRLIPEKYQSETLIMLVPQRVPDEYVKTVTSSVDGRLSSISNQILSRSRLERIVRDLDLYHVDRTNGMLMEDVVGAMRGDIKVTVENKDGFRVTYVNREAATAQKVTERLATLFINENLRDRENQAENTNEFLQSQLEDARRRLLEHERKLEAYRQRYAGQLPTQLPGNLQAIQNAQLQLQSLDESTNRAHERRLLLERQLADAQAPAAPMSTTSSADPAPISVAQQLEIAQGRLNAARQRYTADHPDVKALERTVRELQGKVEDAARNPSTVPARATVSPEEAARRKRIADLQAEMAVIDHQIASNTTESAALKRMSADYQAKVDALPARESELVELTRDYTTLQQNYASLLQKQEDSKLAANLEHRQIGEQFKVLDPASLPQQPYNQIIRLGALAGGVVGGFLIGLALVAFLEYRDSSLKVEEHVTRLIGLPVLALIPQMEADGERVRRLRRNVLLGAATTVVALACAGALLVWKGPA